MIYGIMSDEIVYCRECKHRGPPGAGAEQVDFVPDWGSPLVTYERICEACGGNKLDFVDEPKDVYDGGE